MVHAQEADLKPRHCQRLECVTNHSFLYPQPAKANISPETQRRVARAAEELGLVRAAHSMIRQAGSFAGRKRKR